jgi:malate dehydrogenase (oxaloacetate-decarboxylating)(NADP+)
MLGVRETVFIADTLMHERPSPSILADIAEGAATHARRLGHEPRVALLSHSTFGQPTHQTVHGIREAVAILEARKVDFEFDGDMSPDVALEPSIRALYPFCRLTGNANVLVMPGLHSAHITSRLAPRLGGGSSIGPLLLGMSKAVQLVSMDASVSTIVDMAALAAHQSANR